MSRLAKSTGVPVLCYVTDWRGLAGAHSAETRKLFLEKIAAAARAGVDWVQIRENDLSGRELSLLAHDALQRSAAFAANPGATAPRTEVWSGAEAASPKSSFATEAPRTQIFVNDRLDVALATQADGVHLGERSLPPREARRLVNALGREKDFLIGVSCHSLEAAKKAEEGGANYIFFGPVFFTPSKAAYGAPQGIERLTEVCRAVSIPVLAIGGITLENAGACSSAGAAGIAAIRLFQDTVDVAALVRSLRQEESTESRSETG